MRNVNPEIQSYGDNMSNYGYLTHSELYHHGVKGMKWGVHRYTNADGSLNEAGKKRYRINSDLLSSASKRGARRRYRDVEIDAWRAAREKAKSKGILNKKERKQYINDTAEGYINKQYKDWFKDEGPLNRTRDESAYRYRKSATRNALGNIGKNVLGAAALNTVGIGMFGVSPNQGKIYNDIYKETTRRLQNKKVAQHSALYHHGILGQKWGVRRYQNEDGSLTEAGKKRYLNSYGHLTGNAYTDKFIGKKFGSVEGLDINKYKSYESKKKANRDKEIKSSIKDFDLKLNKTVSRLIKQSKQDAKDYPEFDGKPLTGPNEILDSIWDNFGFINLTDEQYKLIYDHVDKELKKNGIGYYE